MRRIIIDADPGVDDAFAIMLALKSDKLKIEAITTVAGNCSLDNATKNSLKILDLINRKDIPVYKGMDKALKKDNGNADYVHGNNGLGGIKYKPIIGTVEDGHAVDYLIESVNGNPGEITIVAIGPLTNIASAINKDKNFAKNVKELVIMGGSIDKGNITPVAEFNFYIDPDAAKIVFDSDFKNITMIGLDVTTKVPLNKNLEQLLLNMDNEIAKFLYDITRVGADFDRKVGFDGFILNDPLTIGYLIDSSILKLKCAKVNIDIDGKTEGKSRVNFVEKSNCKVAVGVKTTEFYKILLNNIFDYKLK